MSEQRKELTMSEREFRYRMSRAMAWAKKILTEKPGEEFSPTVWAFTRELLEPGTALLSEIKTTVMVIADGFQDKPEDMRDLGATLAKNGLVPVAAVLISEAWVARYTKEDVASGPPPSEHPKREEVLMAGGRTLNGSVTLGASIKLARIRGIARPVSDWEWFTGGPVEANILSHFFLGFLETAQGEKL